MANILTFLDTNQPNVGSKVGRAKGITPMHILSG